MSADFRKNIVDRSTDRQDANQVLLTVITPCSIAFAMELETAQHHNSRALPQIQLLLNFK
jgi:hypothetical protein